MSPRFLCGTAFAVLALSIPFSHPVLQAQEPMVRQAPAVENSSRSGFTQEEMKRMNRTMIAQYRQQQEVMREEYYNWIGYNPSRPTVNAMPMFAVPYTRVHMPWGGMSRTFYYNGAAYQSF